MEKAHSRIKWENYPSIATPLNETNLNKMDIALDEVDNRVLGLDTAKLDKAVANSMVKEITFDEATGIFTITSLDGTTKTIDTKLEKVATNFSYDYETQKLKLTLLDGTEQEIDMSTLISQYEFADTSTIGFTVGNEGKITAIVKDGSITEDKLQPNFLADIKVEVAKGKSYSDSSYENATTSSNASKEAKQYRDEAKQYRDEVQAVVDVDIATTEKAGLVKPDGTTIRVDEDGTIHADAGTVDYTELENKPKINGVELSGDLTTEDLNIDLGTVDYTELENKPSINGTELNGNKTLDELGIASKTNVEALEDEIAKTNVKVDTVIANVDLNIKETASGEEIHLIDSAEGKAVEYALYGKAKQNTTLGNQLLNYEEWKKSTVMNGNGVFENNGVTLTATSQDCYTDQTVFPEQARIYVNEGDIVTLSWEESTNKQASIYLFPNGSTTNLVRVYNQETKSLTYTVPSGVTFITFRFGVLNSGDTISYKNIMINKGATALPYEPYTNGASPNPDYPQEIEVSGESYNLLENTATSKTVNNVTFTVNEDKSITVDTNGGTATANAYFMVKRITFPKGNYILSGCPKGGDAYTYSISVYQNNNTFLGRDIGDSFEFTSDGVENSENRIELRVGSGTKVENITFYPMIRKASVKNDRYMPYGKGSVEVKSCGNSIIDNSLFVQGNLNANDGVTITESTSVRYYNEFLEVSPNNKYTFSNSTGTLRVFEYDKNKALIKSYTVKKELFNVSNECCYIRFQGGNTYMSSTLELNIVSISTIPTENGLAGIKVSSGGNYTDQNGQQWICDEVVKYADGSGKHIKRFNVVDMGVLNWQDKSGEYFVSRDLVGVVKEPNTSADYVHAVSTCFIIKTYQYMKEYDNVLTIIWDDSASHGQIWCRADDYLDKTTFLEKVTGQYLLYELATPIETPLTAEELAEISTFYPVTNISNDFDCGMKVKYNADSKNYIDKMVAEKVASIVANMNN